MHRRDFCKLAAVGAGAASLLKAEQALASSALNGADSSNSYPVSEWDALIQGRNFEANGGKVLPGTQDDARRRVA